MRKLGMLAALLAWMFLPGALAFAQAQTAPPAKACQEDETVVNSILKHLNETVDMVKKESVDDFVQKYHQQVVGSRLSTTVVMTNILLDCLDKASKDPSTPKTDLASIKASQDTYAKLKNTMQQDVDTLKNTKDPKIAKADISNYNFSTQ
ncbi:MAG: hypothetical protein KGM47_13490 [Acidobacteriota bacterium]|nr:hypothetical protein [Acidobacteriota bacterium]